MLLPNVDHSKCLRGVFSKYQSEGRSVAVSWAFLSILGGMVSEQAPCFVGLRTCWALLCLIPSQRARYAFELSRRSRSCRCEAWIEEALLQCTNELHCKKNKKGHTCLTESHAEPSHPTGWNRAFWAEVSRGRGIPEKPSRGGWVCCSFNKKKALMSN